MSTLVKEFQLYLKIEKGLAENTIENYIRDISLFNENLGKDLKEATIHDVRSFLAEQQGLGKSRATVSRYISSIKELYKYLELYHEVESPVKDIKSYHRNSNTLPKYLPSSDMSKLLEAASKSNFKTRLILEMLYGTGCRVSELVNMKVEDFDFVEGFVKILGKGSKERIVPLYPRTLELLIEWIKRENIVTGYIFPKRGNPSEPMSRVSVTNLMKDLSKRAGVESKVSAHVMRHSYATHMVENGCDMATMQALLGHSNITTTQIYAKVTKDLRKRALSSFHPLSQ